MENVLKQNAMKLFFNVSKCVKTHFRSNKVKKKNFNENKQLSFIQRLVSGLVGDGRKVG